MMLVIMRLKVENKLRSINEFLAYEYCIYGGGNYGGDNQFLTLGKSFKEYNEFIEELNIPTPILKTNEWYSRFKILNKLRKD